MGGLRGMSSARSGTGRKRLLKLRVGNMIHTRDVGRSVARIDPEVMRSLGVRAGSFVALSGKREVVVKAWSSYPEDRGLGIIRIDEVTRKNCDVDINDDCTVHSVDLMAADFVELEPVNAGISVDQDFIRYLKERLINRPLKMGDIVLAFVVGHPISFKVVDCHPDACLKVVPETDLVVEVKEPEVLDDAISLGYIYENSAPI